jgi:adenylate cyclase
MGEWPFAIKAASMFLFEEPRLDHGLLSIGDEVAVELDQFNDIYIDYPLLPPDGDGGTANLHDVVGLSALDILFLEDEEELEELSFLVEDRIVLIGEVAEVAHDEFETPVGNVFGVEIIANTISTILRSGPLHPAGFLTEAFVALLMMMFFLGTRMMANPLPRNLVSFGVLALYIVLGTWLYIAGGLVLSMSYVLLASIIAIVVINAGYYITEMAQKAQIRDAFGQYLSPKVVAELEENPDKLTLGGEEREMTAYFSDIQGFSTFSEKMTPTELVNVLNDYLTAMCDIIIGSDGTVDKFEGDAIIAFWGAPTIQDDHATRACLSALDMREALAPLRERFVKQGYHAFYARMGINSGPMVVGNMGSRQKLNYTIMGDAVNLASRLEGANKAYGSYLMISDATYQLCSDAVDVRELDTLRVVGKSEGVKVYELLGRKNTTTGLKADLVTQFQKGLDLYQQREWDAAHAAFKLATSIDKEDGPSQKYMERCASFLDNPPPADWDGIFTLDSKG